LRYSGDRCFASSITPSDRGVTQLSATSGGDDTNGTIVGFGAPGCNATVPLCEPNVRMISH
jgi:hypothetical protein